MLLGRANNDQMLAGLLRESARFRCGRPCSGGQLATDTRDQG